MKHVDTKFKAGDRIRMLSNIYAGDRVSFKVGSIHTISSIDKFINIKMVEQEYPFLEHELEMARVISNKLSKKLYPNWEEKDGYLYAS